MPCTARKTPMIHRLGLLELALLLIKDAEAKDRIEGRYVVQAKCLLYTLNRPFNHVLYLFMLTLVYIKEVQVATRTKRQYVVRPDCFFFAGRARINRASL
jgi:hypothetical protein